MAGGNTTPTKASTVQASRGVEDGKAGLVPGVLPPGKTSPSACPDSLCGPGAPGCPSRLEAEGGVTAPQTGFSEKKHFLESRI